MHPRDKISKSSWTLLETIKDSLTTNLTNAVRGGQLKIEANQMALLLTVIGASADEGYHRGHRTFMKVVESAMAEACVAEAMPELKSAKKK